MITTTCWILWIPVGMAGWTNPADGGSVSAYVAPSAPARRRRTTGTSIIPRRRERAPTRLIVTPPMRAARPTPRLRRRIALSIPAQDQRLQAPRQLDQAATRVRGQRRPGMARRIAGDDAALFHQDLRRR